MATKLTKKEVFVVLDDYRNRGLPRPGLHRLREAIGHGSLARLKRLVHEIDLERDVGLQAKDVAKVPNPVSAAAALVWAELEAACDERQQAIESNLAKTQAVMHDELEGLRRALAETTETLEQVSAERDAYQEALQTAQAEQISLAAELKTETAIQAELRESLGTQAQRAIQREEELKDGLNRAQHDALKRENELKAMLEEAKQGAAADATEARKREDNLRGRLDAVTEAAAKAHASHVQYVATAEAKQQHLEETQVTQDETNKRLGKERDEMAARMLELDKLVARSEARQDALADELKHVRQDLAGAQKRIEALQKPPRKEPSAATTGSKRQGAKPGKRQGTT